MQFKIKALEDVAEADRDKYKAAATKDRTDSAASSSSSSSPKSKKSTDSKS